ncbi:unnamed protein product [Caenorhabditis nigoni]
MPGDQLTEETIQRVFLNATSAKIEEFFSKWNFANANSTKFGMSGEERNLLGDEISAKIDNDDLAAILLETVRLISRERQGLESLLNENLCDTILKLAGITPVVGYPRSVHALMEAQKCLVNTMFHSAKMRERFYMNLVNGDQLQRFLSEFEDSRRENSNIQWIREMNPTQAGEVWYFYHRIAFIATAMDKGFQRHWADQSTTVSNILCAAEVCLQKAPDDVANLDLLRATEAMKTFFNVFCHFHGDVPGLDEKNTHLACRILRDVICSGIPNDDVIQSAIHALSVPPLPMDLSVLLSDPNLPIVPLPETISEEERVHPRDFYVNMTLTEAILAALDKQLIKAVDLLNSVPFNQVSPEGNTLVDLSGPYFQALARLCVESKYARRYCRIRVLPPLVADEVKKRPEEHDSLRGRIVRVMMLPSTTKEVASEFLFIICKRSVSRMIKYVGFGHSAGHLANFGLLGQINQPKHASDSEDSETEDYNAVKDNVNPVTGAMYPPDHGSAMDGMSDAQKEFEAMKLVDAMNKLMDQGLVKPGTIGDDGKVREVSHVLELLKDAPEPETMDSDSD